MWRPLKLNRAHAEPRLLKFAVAATVFRTTDTASSAVQTSDWRFGTSPEVVETICTHYSELTSTRQFTPDFRHSPRELMHEVYNCSRWEIAAHTQTRVLRLMFALAHETIHDLTLAADFLAICNQNNTRLKQRNLTRPFSACSSFYYIGRAEHVNSLNVIDHFWTYVSQKMHCSSWIFVKNAHIFNAFLDLISSRFCFPFLY